jgi:hypothetical protein
MEEAVAAPGGESLVEKTTVVVVNTNLTAC